MRSVLLIIKLPDSANISVNGCNAHPNRSQAPPGNGTARPRCHAMPASTAVSTTLVAGHPPVEPVKGERQRRHRSRPQEVGQRAAGHEHHCQEDAGHAAGSIAKGHKVCEMKVADHRQMALGRYRTGHAEPLQVGHSLKERGYASAAQFVKPAQGDTRRLPREKQKRAGFTRCMPLSGFAKRRGLRRPQSGSREIGKSGGLASLGSRTGSSTSRSRRQRYSL